MTSPFSQDVSASEARREAAQFRRVQRRIAWEKYASEHGRWAAYKALVKSPARAAREALRSVSAYGARTQAATGVSRATQLARFWWLNVRHGITDDNYYRYEMYREDRWRRATHFVQLREAANIYRVIAARALAHEVGVLADKRRFATWCGEHDIPTVPVLMEFAGGHVSRDNSGGALPAADLFSKSASDYGGKKVGRWRYVASDAYEAHGRLWSSDELIAEVAAMSIDGLMLLQPRLTNHVALLPIAPAALSTIRVMTVRAPGERARVLLAVFRMGVGASVADNYAAGGIVSAVDRVSGELKAAVRFNEERYETLTYPVHPDTGAPIAGMRLPFFQEALGLALRAHDAIGELPCVGWDVAPTDEGPVLLEGNWNPCVKIAQLPTGVPLAETAYVRCMNSHLRRHCPTPDWSRIAALTDWNPHQDIRTLGHVTAAMHQS